MDVWVEDWDRAQKRAVELGHGDPRIKIFKDLEPGDGYVYLGDDFTVLWWPNEDERGYRWTMQVETSPTASAVVEINPVQDVATYPTRSVNIGLGRCHVCLCNVQRGHVPGSDDCLMGKRERTASQRDWEMDW